MVVLDDHEVTQRSTQAARSYVLVARDRLAAELARYGPQARQRRSFQQLERSISPEELARVWPAADLEVVLAE